MVSSWRVWLWIAAGLCAYLGFALVAAAVIRKRGGDIKKMGERSSPAVLRVAALTNLAILGATLLLLHLMGGSPRSLRLSLGPHALRFATVACVGLVVLAVLYLLFLRRTDHVVKLAPPTWDISRLAALAAVWGVLAVVALQEEILFRGYMTLGLVRYGPVVIIAVTAVVFTAIHIVTNPAGPAQLAGWLIGGGVLSGTYLVTGSIWVPILVHFAMDMINVVLLDIIGEGSLIRIVPAMTARHRLAYRTVSGVAVVVALFAFYGPHLSPAW